MTCKCNCNRIQCKICSSYKGETGDKGPKGAKGDDGEVGLKGNKGPRGGRGDKGPVGDAGDRGDKGPRGDRGHQGDEGPIGEVGNKGPRGETGNKGNVGPPGNRGDIGDRGLKGQRGDVGDKGLVGEKGPAGPIGPMGFPGIEGPKGDLGPKGDTGAKGPRGGKGIEGPKGDVGPYGPIGYRGNIGEKGFIGPPGGTIAPPNEVILAKVIAFAKETRVQESYVMLNTPVLVSESGVGFENREEVIKSNLSYVDLSYAQNEVRNMISIKNIESFNIVFAEEAAAEKDKFINDVKGIFASFLDCTKSAPQTTNINDDGETISTGDLNFDFEYTTSCSCSGTCECIGRKIDVCKYLSSKTQGLKKAIEDAKNNGKKIKRIITLKPNFLDETKLVSDIAIEDVSLGGLLLSYEIVDFEKFFIVSVVSMDKITAIEFK